MISSLQKVYQSYDLPGNHLEDSDGSGEKKYAKSHLRIIAYLNLYSNQLDTGLTFSKNRKTCIVLGRASDKANFAHTFTHEITHCAMHIANEYGINPHSESLAYIAGDLGAEMLPFASKFLCDCCNKK